MAEPPIKLFPAEVSVVPLATAVLNGVSRVDGHIVARYRLVPDDPLVFRVRVGSQPDLIGKRYEPLLGVWSRFEVAPAGTTGRRPGAMGSSSSPAATALPPGPAAAEPAPTPPAAPAVDGPDVVVDIGVREAYGRAWVNALKQHGRSCETMIPAYQVRAQILGFLADNGV